jgi:hypothetical protein
MIAALTAALIYVAQPHAPPPQPCYSIQALRVNAERSGLHPIIIDDPDLLTALSAALKQAFGVGLEANTVELTAVDIPKDPANEDAAAKTALIESDGQGCLLPSGRIPTEAWHTILDRASA